MSRASSTTTEWPARAMRPAAVSPLWPPPTTIASKPAPLLTELVSVPGASPRAEGGEAVGRVGDLRVPGADGLGQPARHAVEAVPIPRLDGVGDDAVLDQEQGRHGTDAVRVRDVVRRRVLDGV